MLPSEAELANIFKVSQGTIRKALDKMTRLNLVVRRQGKGTFVSTHTPHRALFHFFHLVGDDGSRQLPESSVLSCRTRRATRQECDRLRLDEKARVTVIERLRSLNGKPTIAETIVVSEEMFPDLGRDAGRELPITVYEYYEQRYGVTILNAVERLHAEIVTPRDAELLGLPHHAPVLVIERTAFGHNKQPVEWRVSRCNTTHHHYLCEIE
jgi:GntR family transcriptional regulator